MEHMIENDQIRYISGAETVKIVKSALNKAYPDTKFSVRNGGNAINVYWTDGPTSKMVDGKINLYRGVTFDGIQDMNIRRLTVINGEQVQFGVNHILLNRTNSPELVKAVTQAYCAHHHVGDVPEVKISVGSGYIDHSHPLRDSIMTIVYDSSEQDVSHGNFKF